MYIYKDNYTDKSSKVFTVYDIQIIILTSLARHLQCMAYTDNCIDMSSKIFTVFGLQNNCTEESN